MEHPVSQALLKKIIEHRNANNESLLQSKLDHDQLYRLIGQINAFDKVLEIESFLENSLKEVEDDN